MPLAPDLLELVRKTMREHPEIDLLDDVARGRVLDYVAVSANGGLTTGLWGRKARNKDGSNKNTDVLAYWIDNVGFELYDAIAGADPNPNDPDRGRFATWDYKGTFRPGENGYWAQAEPLVAGPPTPTTPPQPPPAPDYDSQFRDLRTELNAVKIDLANARRELEKFKNQDAEIVDLRQLILRLRVVGATAGRGPGPLSHYHDVNLPVVDGAGLPPPKAKG